MHQYTCMYSMSDGFVFCMYNMFFLFGSCKAALQLSELQSKNYCCWDQALQKLFISVFVCLYVYPQVCVKDSNNIEMDTDVSLEIPSGTVIAYSVLELEIKRNGQYGECVVKGKSEA